MSASSSIVCGIHQSAGVNVTTAAIRVIVRTPVAAPGTTFSGVNSRVSSFVAFEPRTYWILKSPMPSMRTRWPSRKPSARKLPSSLRVTRLFAASKVIAPVYWPWLESRLSATPATGTPAGDPGRPVVSVIVCAVTVAMV